MDLAPLFGLLLVVVAAAYFFCLGVKQKKRDRNPEQMAEFEKNEELKKRLVDQAKAYRKLAADRALKEPLTPPET